MRTGTAAGASREAPAAGKRHEVQNKPNELRCMALRTQVGWPRWHWCRIHGSESYAACNTGDALTVGAGDDVAAAEFAPRKMLMRRTATRQHCWLACVVNMAKTSPCQFVTRI